MSLGTAGQAMWDEVTAAHKLDALQLATLTEICRAKDRLDKLDLLLTGDVDTWARLTHNLQTQDYELKIDAALQQANATANLMKQLVPALRLPDEHGKKPPIRGPRSQLPRGTHTKVTAIDRFKTG